MVSTFEMNYSLDYGFKTNQKRQLEKLEPNLEMWPSFLASYAQYKWHEDIVKWFDMTRIREIRVNVKAY